MSRALLFCPSLCRSSWAPPGYLQARIMLAAVFAVLLFVWTNFPTHLTWPTTTTTGRQDEAGPWTAATPDVQMECSATYNHHHHHTTPGCGASAMQLDGPRVHLIFRRRLGKLCIIMGIRMLMDQPANQPVMMMTSEAAAGPDSRAVAIKRSAVSSIIPSLN